MCIISFAVTSIAVCFGGFLINIISDMLGKIIGTAFLSGLGIYILISAILNREPVECDRDNSHNIDSREACFIGFFRVGQYIAGFGRLAHEHRQHACCHRVERTCVTEAFYPQHAAKFCDDVKGRPALRFVDRQYACKVLVVYHIT